MDLQEEENVIRFVYNLETCGGPGDIEESLSMREGSRGTVAWIQQKASIASVFTPDLQQCIVVGCNGAEVKILPLKSYHNGAHATLCRRYSVWGPQGTVSLL